MQLKEIGEFGLIGRIKAIVDAPSAELLVGIGDDTAAYRTPIGDVTLLTTDTLIEGVHFDLKYFTFYQLGWKAMAANLSDIAAMGGVPKYALVSFSLPANVQVDSVEEFYRAAKELGDKFKTAIIGGDMTQAPEKVSVSLTVIGEVEEEKLTLRSGAQIGDAVFVIGSLGAAQAGLKVLKSHDEKLKGKYGELVEKHLKPQPRVDEARFLVENFPIHSMIDISDGLASEINHICNQSGVGARINAEQIPLDSATEEVAHTFKEKPLEYALTGGEDFELLFTAALEVADELQHKFHNKFGYYCSRIGMIREQKDGIVLEKPDGEKVSIRGKGYDHFAV